jgi:DNA polymerase elongation subunit (family B)
MKSSTSYKLTAFNVYDDVVKNTEEDEDHEDNNDNKNFKKGKDREFIVQMFGINEKGETASIFVEGYTPFFYVMVGQDWTDREKNGIISQIYNDIGNFYEDCIVQSKIIKSKKLYGFDAGKLYSFLLLKFKNEMTMRKVKNLWYTSSLTKNGEYAKKLTDYEYNGFKTKLYEAQIPPLLRLFHIKQISPSGWISLPFKKTLVHKTNKSTSCSNEYTIHYKNIIPLPDKETLVPYKICSFDIEASSSHGDFPIAIKNYKKLAINIVSVWNNKLPEENDDEYMRKIILTAFNCGEKVEGVDLVYPKQQVKKEEIENLFYRWIKIKPAYYKLKNIDDSDFKECEYIDDKLEECNDEADDSQVNMGEHWFFKHTQPKSYKKNGTIIDLMNDKLVDRETRILELNKTLTDTFPKLKGDIVTFIGSTFTKFGESKPYLNHCIVKNSCSNLDEHSVIETYDTEKEVLLAWTKLIQREDPDIIIGYNIFGFDYYFMYQRSKELCITEKFLKLSRNKNEVCINKDWRTGKEMIEESKIVIASGQHDLKYIKMNGRLQIDLYNYLRRDYQLVQYKLDYVSSYFIGDSVKKIEHNGSSTIVYTTNLTGLEKGNYITFEEESHSVDTYKNGEKFIVSNVNVETNSFVINSIESPDMTKRVRWGLAKDDVTPQDIFRLTNQGPDERAIIAKYCIQDCNLVHHLLNKIDVITGYVEMSNLCSVPLEFLVLRGQGIKLTSYIAKKCREKNTLMPVLDKANSDDGYEGAIVLPPKCSLYLEEPVACVDYSSLYPSSMISENISPDSKVWTKEYDLDDNLIEEMGEKDETGKFIYDNYPGYKYVDITYDTYKWQHKNNNPKSAMEKVKVGYKVCRFAQYPEGKAILPSILEECLAARKATRKLIPQQKDDFMKNVLDKRQLSIKVTANSIYGQTGAKTSTFYEKDVAASTTATGRKLLTYARRVIEEGYCNRVVNTKCHGEVITRAEYVYGDSVASYTPVYVRVNSEMVDVITIQEIGNKYGNNEWRTFTEDGKQDKEFCELSNIETWSDKGWTKLYRVIRHKLAPHKKMFRILTECGLVDVTDDHSLLRYDGKEITPNECCVGSELLHKELSFEPTKYNDIQLSLEHARICGKFRLLLENIVNGNKYIKNAFIEGLLRTTEDELKEWDGKYPIKVYDTNQQNAAIICYILQSCGYHTELSFTQNIYSIEITKKTIKDNKIKSICKIDYNDYVYDFTTENHHFAAGIGNLIVHNTDSVFFKFNLTDLHNNPILSKKALEITIEIAQEAGHLASKFLKRPHDLEYEKTFLPFCLLSKKRYVGMLYETDPNKCKRKSMGIVLKRRDNAPIVKDVYGGIIDILMKEKKIETAADYLDKCLQDMINGKVSVDKLIITKSLRGDYKNPNQIAHKVLADRIAKRDPGNKPSPGDRIPFIYYEHKDKKALQGDKIETPTFIRENKLKIDYAHYITNQIMKPVQQLFALVLEDIPAFKKKKGHTLRRWRKQLDDLRLKYTDEETYHIQKEKLRNKEVKELLFDKYLVDIKNKREGNRSIASFFGK